MAIIKNNILKALLITSLILPLTIKAGNVTNAKQKTKNNENEKSLQELKNITRKLAEKVLPPDGTPIAKIQKKFGDYEKLKGDLRYLKKSQNYFYFPLVKPGKYVTVALFFKLIDGRIQGAFLRYDFVLQGRPVCSPNSKLWEKQQKQLQAEEKQKIHYLQLIIKEYKLQ